jgi:RHH-type transcriptional regulator, rel operon repressor / antitoxin RelB
VKAAVINLRIEPEVKTRLERLSEETMRSKSFLIGQAIKDYLDANEWQIEEIKMGLQEIENGKTVSHAAVRAKWDGKIAKD